MISQIFIAIFTCTSIWLLAQKGDLQKWGYFPGIAATPFWLWSVYHAHQYGMMVVSVWVTYCHIKGINNHWIKPARQASQDQYTEEV